jgi:threonine synthase
MSHLFCSHCNATYPLNDPRWKCDCGSVLDISFRPRFDLDQIKCRKATLWRYRDALPIENNENIVSFEEGMTPLLPFEIDGARIWIKQDQLFPTGSYKDRGATVLISKAKELGIHNVVEDSSGNAGCAVAAYCAKAKINCQIYVPAETSPAKLAQIQLYGAGLNLIPGSREDTARAVLKAAETHYYASHSWNPFFFQGTKTFAYEIFEQLGWKAPDTLILPAGNGTLLLGAYIGFKDLLQIGLISSLPRLVAVQAENCAPLYKAFNENLADIPKVEKLDTLAEGIAIAEPIRGKQIVSAVRESGGCFLTVSEDEIQKMVVKICRKGAYIEPTSAATIAAIPRYTQQLKHDEVIVSVFTGHGLKSTEKMLKIVGSHS